MADPHLHRATGLGVATFRLSLIVPCNDAAIADAIPDASVAAVEFERPHVMQIHAEANQPLGIT
ncbi:hypothetical protein D3C81_2093570 [compost metagenome]